MLVDFNPHNVIECSIPQFKFLTDKSDRKIFVGGIGSGKTFTCAENLFRWVEAGRTYLYVARTYADAKDTILPALRKAAGICGRWETMKGDFRGEISTPNGGRATLIVRVPGAQRASSWRGINIDGGVVIEEITYQEEETFKILLGRLRSTHGRRPWIMANCTPKGRDSWVYKKLICSAEWSKTYAVTGSNPFVNQEYERDLIEFYGKSDFADQELHAVWVDRKNQVLPAELIGRAMIGGEHVLWEKQNPVRHTGQPLFAGWDVGGYVHAGAIGTVEKFERKYFLREFKISSNWSHMEQEAYFTRTMERPTMVRGAIDLGGVGHPHFVRFRSRYGERRIVGVQTSRQEIKNNLAMRLSVIFQNGEIVIPNDRRLEADLQMLRWSEDKAGDVEVQEGSFATDAGTTETSHGDGAIMLGLATMEGEALPEVGSSGRVKVARSY